MKFWLTWKELVTVVLRAIIYIYDSLKPLQWLKKNTDPKISVRIDRSSSEKKLEVRSLSLSLSLARSLSLSLSVSLYSTVSLLGCHLKRNPYQRKQKLKRLLLISGALIYVVVKSQQIAKTSFIVQYYYDCGTRPKPAIANEVFSHHRRPTVCLRKYGPNELGSLF